MAARRCFTPGGTYNQHARGRETDVDSELFSQKACVAAGQRSSWNPNELFDFVHKAANYVLTSGAVIKDGDTIGKDAEQKIVVHHGRSKYLNAAVYKLVTP